MKLFKALSVFLCCFFATGAWAETWRHAQSGVSLELPAGLSLGETRDLRSDGTDVLVQLGSGDTIATFYVFRAAYPNVALWYDRAHAALAYNFAFDAPANPRPFSLAGSVQPNGLREEFDLAGRQPRAAPGATMNATAVAIAGHGEWLIKVRISARQAGRAEVTRLMDNILAGVRVTGAARPVPPFALPGACPAELRFSGRRAGDGGAGADLNQALQVVEAAARGRSGLAADPGAWCRLQTALPAALVSVYARRDGSGWVALISDAGAALTTLGQTANAAGPISLYGSSTSGNRRLFNYDGVPPADLEVERGFRPTMAITGNAT